MSSPSNMMLPDVVSVSRLIIIEVVDLPQPDSPTSPRLLPRQRKADAVDDAERRIVAPTRA
jgi:hypothetical protein